MSSMPAGSLDAQGFAAVDLPADGGVILGLIARRWRRLAARGRAVQGPLRRASLQSYGTSGTLEHRDLLVEGLAALRVQRHHIGGAEILAEDEYMVGIDHRNVGNYGVAYEDS